MLKTVLYVQARQDRFIVRKVGGQSIDRMAPQPFSHPRALLGSFTNADAFLRTLVAEAKGGFTLRLEILIHPLEKVEGGLTEIEERAFHELALGMGASKVKVWSGAALSDAEVLEKLKE
jgi:rod shape-determining protein MreB and related proteins